MPITVKKTLFLKDLPKDIKKNFARTLKDDIGDEIIFEIAQGKSPVRGHKFKEYSDGYANTKGRKTPVDMIKKGDMLKSIDVKQDRKGRVKIAFKDKKAEFHQKGKGNLPIRKLLPSKRETFNVKLTKFINKILNMAVKKAIKKQ